MSGGGYDIDDYDLRKVSREIGEMLSDIDEFGIDAPDEVVRRLELIQNVCDENQELIRDVDYVMCGDYGVDKLQEKYGKI